MSWFFSTIPYILAIGTISLGLLQIMKEWSEYKKPWLKIAALVVLMVVGILTLVSLRLDQRARQEEKLAAERDTSDLKGKVQASSDAQQKNTELFLKSLDRMSTEVGNLKVEVKTEDLQKKLASVQADLQKTQKALGPGPKAELVFSFVPFPNPPVGTPLSEIHPVIETTLPKALDGVVHVEFTVLNLTEVEATNADLNIHICAVCEYAKEPEGLTKLAGMEEHTRYLSLPHLQAVQFYKTISVDIKPSPFVSNFVIDFTYRCSTCIVSKKASEGVVHILGR